MFADRTDEKPKESFRSVDGCRPWPALANRARPMPLCWRHCAGTMLGHDALLLSRFGLDCTLHFRFPGIPDMAEPACGRPGRE
jgi:hypothetical protein